MKYKLLYLKNSILNFGCPHRQTFCIEDSKGKQYRHFVSDSPKKNRFLPNVEHTIWSINYSSLVAEVREFDSRKDLHKFLDNYSLLEEFKS